MSVIAIYKLGLKAGLSEADATAAADAVMPADPGLATKADLALMVAELRADLARLESRLTWRLVALTALFIAAVTALRIFA